MEQKKIAKTQFLFFVVQCSSEKKTYLFVLAGHFYKTPKTKMATVTLCIDCGASSTTPLCANCLKARKPCATKSCTMKLNPKTNFAYCKHCACREPTCREPHTNDNPFCTTHLFCKNADCSQKRASPCDPYCSSCTKEWKASASKCVVCRKKPHERESNLCLGCLNLCSACTTCKRNKVHVTADGAKLRHCSKCLCENKSCSNAAIAGGKYCKLCLGTFTICNKLGKLGPCNRLKSNIRDNTCVECCTNPKCTRSRAIGANGEQYDFCKVCHWNYTYKEEDMCHGLQNCFQYTNNASGVCDTCAAQNALQHPPLPKPQDQLTKPQDQLAAKPQDQLAAKSQDQLAAKSQDQLAAKSHDQLAAKPQDQRTKPNLCCEHRIKGDSFSTTTSEHKSSSLDGVCMEQKPITAAFSQCIEPPRQPNTTDTTPAARPGVVIPDEIQHDCSTSLFSTPTTANGVHVSKLFFPNVDMYSVVGESITLTRRKGCNKNILVMFV